MTSSLRRLLVLIAVLVITTISCRLFTSPQVPPSPEESQNPTAPLPPQSETIPENPIVNYVDLEDQLVKLYQRVNPGVVTISVLSEKGGGLGSGFVLDKEGHIVTNFHVILGAAEVEVDFPSGYKTRGTIVGTDPDSDLAVLKVDAPPEELIPIPLGDSDSVQVGQLVVAIGNPHGLASTMTTGIISSLGRTMPSLHEAPGGGSFFTAGDIIQTDAAINPGNSGGPLLNLKGEVIGVNVAIQTNSVDISGQPINSGIGFAISVNTLKRVVPSLIEKGSYDYPYLGIESLSDLNLFQQETLGLPQSTGVYILNVSPGSPAEKAGLRGGTTPTDVPGLFAGGDLIIAIDEVQVRNFNDLISYLIHYTSPGDTVTLTVLREDEVIEIDLVVGKRP